MTTVRKLFIWCVHSWRGFAESVLQVALFTVLWFKWSVKKHCVAKVLLAISDIFLHENNGNYSSCRFSYKFGFILFVSFTSQKQKPGFQEVVRLVVTNISVCLERVQPYFKATLNSRDFCKAIFLHFVPVRIIFPCLKLWKRTLRSLTYLTKILLLIPYFKSIVL